MLNLREKVKTELEIFCFYGVHTKLDRATYKTQGITLKVNAQMHNLVKQDIKKSSRVSTVSRQCM